jgi:hypothetical protein
MHQSRRAMHEKRAPLHHQARALFVLGGVPRIAMYRKVKKRIFVYFRHQSRLEFI